MVCVVIYHWYVLPDFPSGFDTRYLGQTLSGGLKRQLLEKSYCVATTNLGDF
jgi:hypothetical protein